LDALDRSVEHLGGTLFRLSPTQFLICPPYNEHFERRPETPGFVAAVLWAPYEGAARRAVLMDVEADTPEQRPLAEPPPPTELLPRGAAATYGSIISELRTARQGKFLESATFRVATDGVFVHRNISAAPYTFFFRNRKDADDDRCYAIECRLPGYRKAADNAQSPARQGAEG
jgi:hypothetical protein